MEERGYKEESYEAWREYLSDDVGIRDMDAESIETLLEKKMLLGILEEALESLLPDERELAEKVFGEEMSVCEFSKSMGKNRRTLADYYHAWAPSFSRLRATTTYSSYDRGR